MHIMRMMIHGDNQPDVHSHRAKYRYCNQINKTIERIFSKEN